MRVVQEVIEMGFFAKTFQYASMQSLAKFFSRKLQMAWSFKTSP